MKIGIDIGGSHIAVSLIEDDGKIINKLEEDIKKQENAKEYIVNYMEKAIKKLSKNAFIDKIGIAVPGDPENYIVKNLVNLNIKEIDFSYLLEKYNTCVNVINDAKAAGLAEKNIGALKEYKDCVFLCLGTGIGGAVFLNNNLLKTNRGAGFELGHMVIDKNGTRCNCGKIGCFETCCSIKRFKSKIRNILEKIYGDKYGLDKSVVLKQLLYQNLENEEIKEIVGNYINDLEVGLFNIIDIFEPEAICLGGGFVHYKDILYQPIVNKVQEKKYAFHTDFVPEIVLAKFDNEAGMIGAVL